MACGGFSCSRNVLALLNVMYIVVAFVLIGVAAYGKAVAIIATIHVMGGIIACGVFLFLIAVVGLIGAIKHHQVLLFFRYSNIYNTVSNWVRPVSTEHLYMIILFLLFLVQFAVACACLALSDTQQRDLFKVGWQSSAPELKSRTQNFFKCCGYDSTTQNLNTSSSHLGHPSCMELDGCRNEPNATCCLPEESLGDHCPLRPCWEVIEPILHQAVKIVGGLGLFFSFTEIVGVWLAFRYRNQKDPRANPSAFL